MCIYIYIYIHTMFMYIYLYIYISTSPHLSIYYIIYIYNLSIYIFTHIYIPLLSRERIRLLKFNNEEEENFRPERSETVWLIEYIPSYISDCHCP